jgi:hypothetical protein
MAIGLRYRAGHLVPDDVDMKCECDLVGNPMGKFVHGDGNIFA